MVVRSTYLKGHQGAVLCLAHSSSTPSMQPSLLLSGSEDGTCRLWDLRFGRTVSCIKCNNGSYVDETTTTEILSVAFAPIENDNGMEQEQPAVQTPYLPSFGQNCVVYVSVDRQVYGYDLRNSNSPIVTQASIDLTTILDAPDEVNQIVFSPFEQALFTHSSKANLKRQGKGGIHSPSSVPPIHLATADDGGSVRVTTAWRRSDNKNAHVNTCSSSDEMQQKRVFCHSTEAMVTTLAFAPSRANSHKQMLLASGGTDCCIRIWDILQKHNKHSTPVATIPIPSCDTGSNQVCNPPMVHCLDYSPSGRILAAGLGDGSLVIVQGRIVTTRMVDAHTGSVANCLFPVWGQRTTNHCVTAYDRVLCSIGNDNCIVCWDLGMGICGKKASNPVDMIQCCATIEGQDKFQQLQLDDNDIEQPQTLFAFHHKAGKPNWMVSGGNDPVFPSSLFVADTTKNIAIYTMPTN